MLDKRETIHVAPNAWHLRLYDWYVSTHPKVVKPKEDLCHYFWTDVWALLYWYLRVGLWGGISAVWYTAAITIVAFIGYSLWLWTEVALQVLLFLAALVLLVALVGGLVYLMSCYESFSSRTQKILAIIFAPLWIPFFIAAAIVYGLIEICVWIDIQSQRYFHKSFWSWYFTSHKFWLITPWSVTLMAIIAGAYAIFGFEAVSPILLAILGFLAALALIVVVAIVLVAVFFLAGSFVKEKWQNWQYRRQKARRSKVQLKSTIYYSDLYPDTESPIQPDRPVAVRKVRGTSSYRVVWQFLVAIKHRFCPYIEISRA